MKVLKVLGWIFVPFIMIFVFWKQLSKPMKILGSIWAIFIFIQMIITWTNDKGTDTATDVTNNEINQTADTEPGKQSDSKPVDAKPDTKGVGKAVTTETKEEDATSKQSDDEKKRLQEEQKKKQDQDAVLKFEKDMYALEDEINPFMDAYQKALNGVSDGSVDIFTAYEVTENAKKAAEGIQRKYYNVEVPKDLPKEVKKELEDAKTDLATAYYTKAEAFGYVLKYFDDQKPSYMSKFQDEISASDSFIMSGVLKLFKAKELVGLEVVEEEKK